MKIKTAFAIFAGTILLAALCFNQITEAKTMEYPDTLLMTEILPFPNREDPAWIEFYNPHTMAVKTTGLSVVINKEFRYRFPEGLPPVPPRGFALLLLDGKGEIQKPQFRDRTVFLHAPWDLTSFLQGKPGQVAVYHKQPDKKTEMVGFVRWGAPGSQKDHSPKGDHLWRPQWFVETTQGSGDYDPGALKKANYTLGLYPGSTTSGLTDWVIYFRDEATPGGLNIVPRLSAISPHEGAVVRSEDIAFGWISSKHARKFRFQLSDDPYFASLIVDELLKIPQYRPPRFLPEGTYYYHVMMIDDAGRESAFSQTRKLISKRMGALKRGQTDLPPEKILNPMELLYQRKDTHLLCLDGCASDLAGGSTKNWDSNHPSAWPWPFSPGLLDPDHGLGNCARASIAMMVSHYGKKLSQDRIAYFTEEESPLEGNGTPEADLAHFEGMSYSDVDGGAETGALDWALGTPVEHKHSPPSFSDLKVWLYHNRPIMTRIPLVPIIGLGHVRVMDGYRIDNTNTEWVRILDPLELFWSPRWVPYASWASIAAGVWVGPAIAPATREDEPGIWSDTDCDGIMDFDETRRFLTDPSKKDSDGDGVFDKEEIRKYVFDSGNNYHYGNPDGNANGVRKELDPNE